MTFDDWAVSLAVFLPLVGAGVIALMPGGRDRLIRALGILFTAVPLIGTWQFPPIVQAEPTFGRRLVLS